MVGVHDSVVVLMSGEAGRQKAPIDWAHFVTLGLLILSESVLFGDDPYTLGHYSSMQSCHLS